MLNETMLLADRGLWERVMLCSITTVSCCVFLFVNGTMLVALKSKPVFRDTCRYVLLYNLLFADTVQITFSQLLYLLAALRLRITYPVCVFITSVTDIVMKVSPVTLVVMSFDRYVAVCYPLQHATIVTRGTTRGAISVIWVISSLNQFSRVSLLWENPFADLASLQMKHFCSADHIPLGPIAILLDNVHRFSILAAAGLSVSFSYIRVLVAARSASTDRASAHRAHKTLLLHLFQLGLNLASTVVKPLLKVISQITDSVTLVRVHIFIYVCVVIFPNCLSSLMYSIRDQTIRPVLLNHLLCHLTTCGSR